MGLPSFSPPAESQLGVPFWEAVQRGELVMPQCGGCARWSWYPDETGPCCVGHAYRWVPVSGSGTVHALTRVHRSFLPDDAVPGPYVVALVELDDVPGARLVSNLDAEATWSVGDRVEVSFVEHRQQLHPVFVHG